MKIEKITSEEQYKKYLKKAHVLITSEYALTKYQERQLLNLADAIEEYEAEHYPV